MQLTLDYEFINDTLNNCYDNCYNCSLFHSAMCDKGYMKDKYNITMPNITDECNNGRKGRYTLNNVTRKDI